MESNTAWLNFRSRPAGLFLNLKRNLRRKLSESEAEFKLRHYLLLQKLGAEVGELYALS